MPLSVQVITQCSLQAKQTLTVQQLIVVATVKHAGMAVAQGQEAKSKTVVQH